MDDDPRAPVALGLVVGENRILVGDEEEGWLTHPELDLLAEGSPNLLRLALAQPCPEEKLDATDNEETRIPALSDESKQVIGGEDWKLCEQGLVPAEPGEDIQVLRL